MEEDKKEHWERIYHTKNPGQVSWTQAVPQTSLNFIRGFDLAKTDKIIDIGGGDSKLVDFLLQEGYTNITVLDISETALAKAKTRLGNKSSLVTWIVCDITNFEPKETYAIWHDRAAFHFLTTQGQITRYLNIAAKAVSHYLIIGTFSENGPEKCSGLTVKQYTEQQLQAIFNGHFEKVTCITEDHTTPFATKQNFLFCSFKKRKDNL
jgi:SAM-dependent methyltransferase